MFRPATSGVLSPPPFSSPNILFELFPGHDGLTATPGSNTMDPTEEVRNVLLTELHIDDVSKGVHLFHKYGIL